MNLIWDTLVSAALGFALAYAIYGYLARAPYSLRLIDLASFFLGFVALVGAVISSYNARNVFRESIDRIAIGSAIADLSVQTRIASIRICDRVKHSPYKPPAARSVECERLNRYVDNLSFDPTAPIALRIPNWVSYADPVSQGLAKQTFARAEDINRQIEEFVRETYSNSTAGVLEVLFKEISISILAFAFGLGVARRIIDFYLLAPPRLRILVDRRLRFSRHLFRRFYLCLRHSVARAAR